jgi:Large-conductance mechanosensitive channel, MscL
MTSPTPNMAPLANALDYKPISDFAQFIKEFNVVGLGIASIVATNTIDIGRTITESIVMPLVNSFTTGKSPRFSFGELASSGVTFLVTMLIIFILLRLFNLSMSKPVTFVRVVNFGDVRGDSPGGQEGSMLVAPVMMPKRKPPAKKAQ